MVWLGVCLRACSLGGAEFQQAGLLSGAFPARPGLPRASPCFAPTACCLLLLPQAFPLFLRARDWMRLLDGSTAVPFYDRHPDGGLVYDSDEDEDPDGTSMRIDLGAELDAADEGEEGGVMTSRRGH